MSRLFPLLIFLCCCGPYSVASTQPSSNLPQVGTPAPDILLEQMLQGPDPNTVTLEALRGNVVVFEFWATWCSPCVPAMEQLEAVATELEGEAVQFIAISEEEASPVLRFLEHRPTRLWVGLDTDGSAFDAYRPAVIPHTVIVDREGRIAAITNPEHVTAEALRTVLAGESVNLPMKPYEAPEVEIQAQREEERDADALYKAVMRPSKAQRAYMKSYGPPNTFAGRRMTFSRAPVLVLVSEALGVPNSRIVDEADLPTAKEVGYDVDVIVPSGRENELRPALRHLVLTGLGLKIETVEREVEVQVLRLIDGAGGALQPSEADSSQFFMQGPLLFAVDQPFSRLVGYLENSVEEPVVDETGLEGRYDFEMDWTYGDASTFYDALRVLGLELVPARRKIELYVVRRAEQ